MEKEQKQTELTTKKPSVLNRVISIILLVLITVFSVGTLVLSVTPKNYNFGLNEPASIKIYTSNDSIKQSKWLKGASDGVYDKVMELFNNSFNTTLLNSMFKGVLFDSANIVEGIEYFSSIKGDYIEFQYNEVQTLTLNGKEYSPKSSGINKNYVSVIITVENTNSLSKVTAYVRHGGTNTDYDYSRIRFESYAIQSQLYEYINSL
ncbi:MAG: hypothetical protein ACI4TZ_01030 [Christensenellales bacterium]